MTKNAPTAAPAPKISTQKTWPSKLRTWLAPLLVGLAHSALMMVAAPPLDVWPAVFIALLPLAWLVSRPTSRPWRDALLVTIGALPMWGVWEWWTSEVTGLGYIPFVCLQASYVGLFLLVARRFHRLFPRVPLAVVVPTIWVAVEVFRGEIVLDGYAWGLLAHPLIAVTALASPAALLGTYFVSFLAGAVNGAFADFVFAKRRTGAAVAAGCCAAAWIAGALCLPPIDPATQKVRPAIVQTNVLASNKTNRTPETELEDWKDLKSMTQDVAGEQVPAGRRPDFVLWPETMVPGRTIEPDAVREMTATKLRYTAEDGRDIYDDAFANDLNQLQRDIAVPMVVGAIALLDFHVSEKDHHVQLAHGAKYNSVYLVNSGAVQLPRYDKVRLTPFGETMPYIRAWPWLQEQMLGLGANGMKFDLAAGTHLTVLNVPVASLGRSIRVVTPVCFEITVASHVRSLVFGENGQRRADLIASITNDGWFSDTDIARQQHLQAARWRCVELATPMARAANTGISALVDAHGRIVARGVEGNEAGARAQGILIGQVPLGTKATLYARVGDIFGWATLLAGTLALIASFFRRKASPAAEQTKKP